MSFHQFKMNLSGNELTRLILKMANICLHSILYISNNALKHFASISASLNSTKWLTFLMKSPYWTLPSTKYVEITPSFYCRIGTQPCIPIIYLWASLNFVSVYRSWNLFSSGDSEMHWSVTLNELKFAPFSFSFFFHKALWN